MKILINIDAAHLTRHELHCALGHLTYSLPDLPEADIAIGTEMKVFNGRNNVIGAMTVSADEPVPSPHRALALVLEVLEESARLSGSDAAALTMEIGRRWRASGLIV